MKIYVGFFNYNKIILSKYYIEYKYIYIDKDKDYIFKWRLFSYLIIY